MVTIIVGKRIDGTKFRPSDWNERLACCLAQFNADKRLQYHPYVTPVFVEMPGVRIDKRLIDIDKDMYNFFINFAADNNLVVLTDE